MLDHITCFHGRNSKHTYLLASSKLTDISGKLAYMMETFNDRIRAARDAKGLSQAQVASRLGVTRPAISLMETTSKGIDGVNLLRLCELLEVSPWDIMFGDTHAKRRYDQIAPSEPTVHHAAERAISYTALIGGTNQPLVIPPDCADIVHELVQANLATTLGKQMLFALRQIIRAHTGQAPLPPLEDPTPAPAKRNVAAMAAKAAPPRPKN